MFEEGRLYAPVTTADDGSVTVHLDDDHPGAADPEYRRRRNQIASEPLAWGAAPPGTRVPRISYTDDEQGVWRTVHIELRLKHARWRARTVARRWPRSGCRPTGSRSWTNVSASSALAASNARAAMAGRR
jgi:Biopterin-dependent aromatic amino acid hydroxylase